MVEEAWEVIHHVNRGGSDVAIASNRKDKPQEWQRAQQDALINMRRAISEALRWAEIADEMARQYQNLRFMAAQESKCGPGATD